MLKHKEYRLLRNQLSRMRLPTVAAVLAWKLIDHIDELSLRIRRLREGKATQCPRCNGWQLALSEGSTVCNCESTEEATDKSPKTVDGVPIVLGMSLWIRGEDRRLACIEVQGIRVSGNLIILDNNEGVDAYSDWAYSTCQAAALAATFEHGGP